VSPRGRRGGRGRRRPAAGKLPAVQPIPGADPETTDDLEQDGVEAPPPDEKPRAERRGRAMIARAERPSEPPLENEAMAEDEVLAHREIAADARSAPSVGPQSVAAFTSFLRSLGIDPRRDPEYTVTAQLTADFLAERTAALRREPAPLRPSRYRGHAGETVRLEKIPVYGMCPHHLVPYFGSISVRYVPSDRICGIGAIARLVRELACVPKLQEAFTQAVADAIERDLEPLSIEVVVRARHLCLEMRGVEQKAVFVTEAKRGTATSGPAPGPNGPERAPHSPQGRVRR
jgi:GTP cyclohydrolase I